MSELRLLFDKARDGYSVRLENDWGGNASAPLPFTFSLTDADYDDLRWYLEDFMDLPDGGSVTRAQRIEESLDDWGRRLFDALFTAAPNQQLLAQLRQSPGAHTLTIATSDLAILRLPWELMADAAGALCFQGVSIRRQLKDAAAATHRPTKLPLRILLVVSRPADRGFIDPRLTSASLLDALKPLGDNATVDFVRPPTLARLQEMLADAERRHDPYDIVHFDGHGTFLPDVEIGALCFEQPGTDALAEAKTQYVRADTLGQLLAKHRVPLVILEACRSGTLGKLAVFRAVAPRLIEVGVGSVISMGHAVHVEAAHIFLERFYREIVQGVTVGQAIEQGRASLLAAPARWLELGPGARTVELRDWFLPHLYQRGNDQPILPTAAQVPDKFDVFLSHNSADKPRVQRLALLLKNRHGLRVWFDAWEVQRGLLHEQCVEGVKKSRVTLIACTKKALELEWVTNEKNWAFAAGRTGEDIVPLLFEEIKLPLDLEALTRVDFRDPAKDGDQAAEVARLVGPPLDGEKKRKASRAPAGSGETGAFPRPPQYGFQGRARELYQLERQFRSHRGILLHAMGGMGKTSLATEAAHWWTRTGLFPDGACFVSFEQFASADRVVQVLGEYLEGVSFNSLPAEEQHRRAKELFQQKRVLLVWDDFESVLPQFNQAERSDGVMEGWSDGKGGDAAALANTPPLQHSNTPSLYSDSERQRLFDLFRDLTDAPNGHGRLLITCRPAETGLATARATELRGLARPDALSLLVRVLEKSGADLEENKLTRERLNPLLDLLADHPLSIELVGPHLKRLTPEEICADFGKLLAEFKVGAGKERNESLLASLAFSTRRLSDAAQQALPWLGLFSGGVFEQVLLDVSQIPPAEWEAMRAELEATALIRVEREMQINGRPYLRFHPTLVYAASSSVAAVSDRRISDRRTSLEQQPAVGDRRYSLPESQETRKRFIAVYLAVMQALDKALGGSQPRWGMEVLAREEANYRTAVHWAVADQAYDVASALGHTFRDYLERSGRLRERDTWVAWLAGEVRKGGFTKEAAAYERRQAWSLFTQGHPQQSLQKLQALVERLRHTTEFDPAFQLAAAQTMLGRVLDNCGLSEHAIPVLEEAVRLSESHIKQVAGKEWQTLIEEAGRKEAQTELGDLSAILGDLANALRNAGRLDEALGASQEALRILENLSQLRDVAAAQGICAQILMAQGRHAEADARYDSALAAARRAGDKGIEAVTLQRQGTLARQTGQLDRAARLYQHALKLFQEMNHDEGVMQTCNLLGVAEASAGRVAEARAWFERSKEIAQRIGDTRSLGAVAQNVAIAYQQEGQAARERGDEQRAVARFREALGFVNESLKLASVNREQPGQADAHAQRAELHFLLGELDEAELHAHQAREIRERLGLKEVSRTYDTLAKIAHTRGDAIQAAEWGRKRDAVREELDRRARGGSNLPSQLLDAVQQLSIACAQAGFGQDQPQELDPAAESALAQLEMLSAPLPDLGSFLRALARGEIPAIPSTVPTELQRKLTQVLDGIREPRTSSNCPSPAPKLVSAKPSRRNSIPARNPRWRKWKSSPHRCPTWPPSSAASPPANSRSSRPVCRRSCSSSCSSFWKP